MKVVVDIFGGDNSPDALVKGSLDAMTEIKNLEIVMVGDSDKIKAELDKYKHDDKRIEIFDAKDVVTNDDVPTMAIKTKKESSLVKALELLDSRDDTCGLVSAGSTGAVLTGGIFKVKRLDGINRPALAPVLPTKTGGNVCLIDCGANVDCRPEFLTQFAVMGSCYMKAVYGIENPRVGLVSVGVEDKKGNELTKEVFKVLKEMPINFVGNMEARDALSGNYDVLVCDGFVGNVLLKTAEGTAGMVMSMMKKAIMSSASAKFGALFMKKAFKKLKYDMDYNTRGGAPFLGVRKIIVKAHGGSNDVAVKAAVIQTVKMAENNLVDNIRRELNALQNNE